MFQIRDASFVNDLTKTASSPDDDIYISVKLNIAKKLAHGLGDPSDGLHDPLLKRINWNTVRDRKRGKFKSKNFPHLLSKISF